MSLSIRLCTALVVFLPFFCCTGPAAAQTEPPPEAAEKELLEALAQARKAQEKADAWAREREKLMAEIRTLENRRSWLQYQQHKHGDYLQEQKDAIARVESRREKAERIRQHLEPYLDGTVQRLEAFVERDLPFLPEERERRLQFLRDTLKERELETGEKLRRILEALQVEAQYGRSLEKTEATLELEGEPTRVHLFRMGRVALFYLSLDRERAGRFNEKSGTWEPLDSGYARNLARAVEMAERKRAMELVELPLGPLKSP